MTLTPNTRPRMNPTAARPTGMPTATPATASVAPSRTTMRATLDGCAPSAMRSPNSLVRRDVEYAVTPYSPSAARTSVNTPKKVVTFVSSKSSVSEWRTRLPTGSILSGNDTIDTEDGVAYGRDECDGIARDAHQHLERQRLIVSRVVRHVEPAHRTTAHVVLLHIAHERDDRERLVVERDRAANRIAPAEIRIRHRLIDCADLCSGAQVARLEVASAKNARTDRMEILRSDNVVIDLSLRICLRNESRNGDVPAGAAGEDSLDREARCLHAVNVRGPLR